MSETLNVHRGNCWEMLLPTKSDKTDTEMNCYIVSRMEYEERNRKKEVKEIAILELMEKMKETKN